MRARILRPARTAMQSGKAKTKKWVLDFEQSGPRAVEPLMGWTSSSDMRQQLRLSFDTLDEALSYAERNGIEVTVEPERKTERRKIAYADNFRSDRRQPWSH
ncbi:MAG: ETC complex I subunit [Pseudomonadota bacterium]